jgi:hypothetical protein
MKRIRLWPFLSGLLLTLAVGTYAVASLFNTDLRYANRDNTITFGLGVQNGGMALAGDYEYLFTRDFGVGATVRYYTGAEYLQAQVLALGAYFRAHVPLRSWEIYVAPGLMTGRAHLEPFDSQIFFGPMFSVGTMMVVTPRTNFGVESTKIINMITSDNVYRGTLIDDIMFRFSIALD